MSNLSNDKLLDKIVKLSLVIQRSAEKGCYKDVIFMAQQALELKEEYHAR